MKKFVQVLLILSSIAISAVGQTVIPNGSFETWVNSGQATATPQYYNSNKDGNNIAQLGPQTCFQETSNPHSGTYCVKVESGSTFGQTVNGSCTTGEVIAPDLTKADGYLQSIAGNSQYAMSFTGRPDSIVFWYRFTSVGSDYPTVNTRLHVGNCYDPETPVNSNHPDSTVNIIARALWTGPSSSVSAWTRVSIPFTYVDGRTPQYIMINMTPSGNQSGGSSGSTLWLDDIAAIYNPTIATGSVSAGPFYVSSTAGAAVSVPFTLTGPYASGNSVTAQLSDANGSFASPVTIGSISDTVSGTINATIPAGTASGTGYRIRVVSSNPALTAADNGSDIQIVLATNAVAPVTTQYIPVNTNGTVLTVTETSGFTTNQWQYSTTSGGPYSAFTVAQTGTTYTPNFTSAGTYYIVCTTTYPGSLTVTSNQVQITVIQNSIAPSTVQSVLAGTNGTALTVTETPGATSRQWQYGTASGGPYQSFGSPQTGLTYTPNFANPGAYYVVCVSAYPGGATTTSNEVQINSVQTSVNPGTTQNFLLGSNGNPLTVTETPTASNRQWFYSSNQNGPFSSFTTAQTGTTYTPSFANGGTYYVICVSGYPGLNDTSSAVQINVIQNSVSPSASQSLTIGQDGNTLTVSEVPVMAAARYWAVSGNSGGPYTAITPSQINTSYTPNFTATGTYYVVCISTINGLTATSNEVLISVGTATVATGTITGSPFLFSPSAPNANVNVPFTKTGTFEDGNVFTAQLSDASGSFNNPLAIGTLADTASGIIAAVIPNTTPAGTGYRIRVIASSPAILGSDNGMDIIIEQFNNSISPDSTQTLALNTDGSTLTVTASQTSTQQWEYSTTSGSGYVAFVPAQTASTYTPNFATPGTYYIVCVSANQYTDSVTSNEVEIIVQNGTEITTSAVSGSPFNVSPHQSVPVTVSFTSDAVFNADNVFTAQLSDSSGSFANAVTIGTASSDTVISLQGSVPGNTASGTAYRIRVVSSDPAITGSDNGSDLTIIQFNNRISPDSTQNIAVNTAGNALTVTSSQSATNIWEYSNTSGSGYQPVSPAQTGNTWAPQFGTPGTYYIVCVSVNNASDSVTSNEVQVNVANGTSIQTSAVAGSPYYISDSAHVVVSVAFTSDAVFNQGNIFTVQLSDNTGSFTSPIVIGTLSSDAIGNISALIPDNSPAGTAYRIRVVSSSPAITGADNGTDLQIIPFEITIGPVDSETTAANTPAATLTANSTQPVTAYNWQWSQVQGFGYANFNPLQTADTIAPEFQDTGIYYLNCTITNAQNASITSQDIVIIVTAVSGINGIESNGNIKAYWNNNDFMVDLRNAKLISARVQLMDINGQIVVAENVLAGSLNRISTNLASGTYIFSITDGRNTYAGKTLKL